MVSRSVLVQMSNRHLVVRRSVLVQISKCPNVQWTLSSTQVGACPNVQERYLVVDRSVLGQMSSTDLSTTKYLLDI